MNLKRTDWPSLAELRERTYDEVIAWAGPDERKLRRVAYARNYESGWVYHTMQRYEDPTYALRQLVERMKPL